MSSSPLLYICTLYSHSLSFALSHSSGITRPTPRYARTGKAKCTKNVVVHSRNLRTPSRSPNALPGWVERGNGLRPQRARGCLPPPPLRLLRSLLSHGVVAYTICLVRLMFTCSLWIASIAQAYYIPEIAEDTLRRGFRGMRPSLGPRRWHQQHEKKNLPLSSHCKLQVVVHALPYISWFHTSRS